MTGHRTFKRFCLGIATCAVLATVAGAPAPARADNDLDQVLMTIQAARLRAAGADPAAKEPGHENDPVPTAEDIANSSCTQEMVNTMNSRYGTLVGMMLEFERAYVASLDIKCFDRLPKKMARYRPHRDEIEQQFTAEGRDIPAAVRTLMMNNVRMSVSGLCQTNKIALAESIKAYDDFIAQSRARHETRVKAIRSAQNGIDDDRQFNECKQIMEQPTLEAFGMKFKDDPLLGLSTVYIVMQGSDYPGLAQAVDDYRAARASIAQKK